jgi:hypothetical protein
MRGLLMLTISLCKSTLKLPPARSRAWSRRSNSRECCLTKLLAALRLANRCGISARSLQSKIERMMGVNPHAALVNDPPADFLDYVLPGKVYVTPVEERRHEDLC